MTSAPTETAAVEQAGIASRFRPYPTAPMPALHCLIEDQPLVSVDWSLGGLQAEPYAGTLRPGADFSISAIGPGAGALSCASHATRVRLMPVGIRARVVRIEKGVLAALFVELDARAFDVLEAMMLRRRQYLASLAATARAGT